MKPSTSLQTTYHYHKKILRRHRMEDLFFVALIGSVLGSYLVVLYLALGAI